jgi:NAD(P)-dependent dehydrogenase (short-subunit alcohol dehydrogenase family)
MEHLAEITHARLGPVRLLVNNAGIETTGRLWEITPERWRQVLAVNVDGVFHGIRAFMPHMLAAGLPAQVVNLSSIGGITVAGNQTPYIVSKHAVRVISECLALELLEQPADVGVSVVLPGAVRSRIFEDAENATGSETGARHLEQMRELLATQGISAKRAATTILDGVRARRFWIYTHPQLAANLLRARADQLVSQRPPAPSVPGPAGPDMGAPQSVNVTTGT